MQVASWLLAATSTPPASGGPDPGSVSPGLIGFLATFGLVVACLLLFASMVGRLRRMRYRAEHEDSVDDVQVDDVQEDKG